MKTWFSTFLILFFISVSCRADLSQDFGARGMSAFGQGNFNLAIKYFTQAIELNTNYVGAYYYRALSYMGRKQYDKSIEDLSQALSLNTNNADAWYFRIILY